MSTPKKYIDLEDRVFDEVANNSRTQCRRVLAWLDDHPDRVPGRTITESEYEEIVGWCHSAYGVARGPLSAFGRRLVTVDPDPEPTNAELIDELLAEFAHLNASCGGEQGDHDLAEFLDARGVRAGGDDE